DARMLLDELLQRIGRDQQLVQAEPALEAAAAALLAGLGLGRAVQRKLALVVAVQTQPILVDALDARLRVFLERARVHQLFAILVQQRLDLGRLGRVRLLATRAQAPRQALREDAEQR